jgi:hypothetical protein
MSAKAFKFFSDVGDSAKKYKMVIFKPKPTNFGSLAGSPDLCKNTGAEYLMLGSLSHRNMIEIINDKPSHVRTLCQVDYF